MGREGLLWPGQVGKVHDCSSVLALVTTAGAKREDRCAQDMVAVLTATSGAPRGAGEHSGSTEVLGPPTWFPVISAVVGVVLPWESYLLEIPAPET